jgi:hypothetical protein
MDKKYVFHSSCYDKELLLKRIILLNDNTIDFKTIEKSVKAQFRAPLSGYFEVEIHIIEDDFEKGSELLSKIDEL